MGSLRGRLLLRQVDGRHDGTDLLVNGVQLDLFTQPKSKLGHTLDAITERFGEHAISRAVKRSEKLTPGRTKKRGT